MRTLPVMPDTPNLRLLGRMDFSQRPLCLDWTGTGLEVRLQGSGQRWFYTGPLHGEYKAACRYSGNASFLS